MKHPRYNVRYTKKFRKDVKRLKNSGVNLASLEQIIELLATNEQLPFMYRDHALKGKFYEARECHIKPNWLLIYKRNTEESVLIALRTGTHRDVLGTE